MLLQVLETMEIYRFWTLKSFLGLNQKKQLERKREWKLKFLILSLQLLLKDQLDELFQ